MIIFDEATSSLDSITEKTIAETIRDISKLRPNLMMVMVAHRLSTVAHADTIYVIEKSTSHPQNSGSNPGRGAQNAQYLYHNYGHYVLLDFL